ncbi:MAG TPA: 1,2-phenylacetyl-CoA epoxidase subunit A, partial [Calditerricola sp.]
MTTATRTLEEIRAEILQDEQKAKFLARIERGEKIEATDWMPDEYRQLLIRLIHMHGVSEIMG